MIFESHDRIYASVHGVETFPRSETSFVSSSKASRVSFAAACSF